MFDSACEPRQLRPHQIKAIEMLRSSFGKGFTRVVLQAPTGFGKSITAAKIIESALAKNKRVLFTVPRLSLIDQTVSEFEREGINHIGVIQAQHPRTDATAPVQVATVQTLGRQGVGSRAYDMVIMDEAHIHADIIPKLMEAFPETIFLGLSATPWAKGMGLIWQDLVIAGTIGEFIETGFLSKFHAFAPDNPDLQGIKISQGDYAQGELSREMSKTVLVGSVVSTWMQRGEGRPTLVFGVNCAHAQVLQQQFIRQGISAGYCDAHTDRVARKLLEKQFRAGEISVVCSVRTLTTGVDWPVSCIVDAAPTKSESLHVQKIGRGLRINPGTEDCLSAETEVLTDKGIFKISDITLDHKVWDGVSFVKHGGSVCRGIRPVISYDGLTGTPDHRVMTEYGWRTLYEAASGRLRIARTGIGRFPIRFLADRVSQGGRQIGQAESGSSVRPMRSYAHVAVSQHSEASGHEGLPKLQWPPACDGSVVVVSQVPGSAGPLPEPEKHFLWTLRREGYRIQVREPKCSGDVGSGNAGSCEPLNGFGPDRQQRALRGGQYPLGEPGSEHSKQPTIKGLSRSVHWAQAVEPGGQVFGQLAAAHDPVRVDGFRDSAEMGGVSGQQSCEEVWDILNAGPLQRFTANGCLVHNCLILDHAGNSLRLGLVTDIYHDQLDKTERGKKAAEGPPVKLPKPCAKCETLHTGLICPACGNERKPIPGVETVDGDLVEITDQKRTYTMAEKQKFWSMALWLDDDRHKAGKLAKGLYKGKFDVWPQGLTHFREYPDPAFWNYEKYSRIQYAKRMAKMKKI